jgi:hypothetical protein
MYRRCYPIPIIPSSSGPVISLPCETSKFIVGEGRKRIIENNSSVRLVSGEQHHPPPPPESRLPPTYPVIRETDVNHGGFCQFPYLSMPKSKTLYEIGTSSKTTLAIIMPSMACKHSATRQPLKSLSMSRKVPVRSHRFCSGSNNGSLGHGSSITNYQSTDF